DPDRHQQRGDEVAALPRAQIEHALIRRVPFDAAVPAQVVVLAVGVLLAVSLVVLAVVADEVGQREAVVRGDEVDARVRTPPALLVEIAAAREPRRQLGERAAVAAPEAPYRVAVLAVPLRPFRREVPDLVPAFAQIPRLGDQLDLRQDRVLMNDVKERTELVDSMQLTSQCAREIEAEPVDV